MLLVIHGYVAFGGGIQEYQLEFFTDIVRHYLFCRDTLAIMILQLIHFTWHGN